MALYPGTDAPITEMLIGGVWTDVSEAPREGARISISRGRANEQGRVSPQRCDFTVDNRDGRFSNRNPMSPYYRLLPRNTQMRVSAGTGDSYMNLPADAANVYDRAITPDVAALDIAGDIDIRADIEPISWRPQGLMPIATKWHVTGEEGWVFYARASGTLSFSWSTNGTTFTTVSSFELPADSARLGVRVTMDVDNGAGQHVITFWRAASIAGPWTSIGTHTRSGTTSIFTHTQPLSVGAGTDFPSPFAGGTKFGGKIYGFQMRNGINGTIVANADFASRAPGATAWVDSAGRSWTLNGAARITSDRIRFHGEISSFPVTWDKTSRESTVAMQASGVLRRLSKGRSAGSSLYRAMVSRELTIYLPLEDGPQSTSVASAVNRAPNGSIINVELGAASTMPGASSVARFAGTNSKITAEARGTGVTGVNYFTAYIKLNAAPASVTPMFTLTTTGTARRITIGMSTTQFNFAFYAADGTTLDSVNSIHGAGNSPVGQWVAVNLLINQVGAQLAFSARWSAVSRESFTGIGPIFIPSAYVGRITTIEATSRFSSSYVDAEVAHINASNVDLDFVDYETASAANGYLGELAGERMKRLGQEEDITVEIEGPIGDTEPMGYQLAQSFVELMHECAEADGGILAELRDVPGLSYVTRTGLEARRDLTLDHSASHLSETPTPTEDDSGVFNDVTVSRPQGSSARREIETGPMSTLPPPSGIDRYETNLVLNIATDDRLEDAASWVANLGSVDEARIPNLTVGLHRSVVQANAPLLASLLAAEIGNTVSVQRMPIYTSPDDALLIVQGYQETLSKFLHEIVFNTTPAAVYNTGRYGTSTEVGRARYDHETSTLAGALTSSATSFTVNANSATPATPDLWTTKPASFPFDIIVGGERMTVTNITGAASPQTFTVTRAVNGIVKAHAAGARVSLFLPNRWGL